MCELCILYMFYAHRALRHLMELIRDLVNRERGVRKREEGEREQDHSLARNADHSMIDSTSPFSAFPLHIADPMS